MSGLQQGPEIFKWILDRADKSLYKTKTDAERFAFAEIFAHMADWEPISMGRMQSCVEAPGSTVQVWDEIQRAIDLKYLETDPAEQLELWTRLRADTIQFLSENADGNWEKSVLHPERGIVSLADVANMEVAHDTYHIRQLLDFLA